jgi:hypothetical protein
VLWFNAERDASEVVLLYAQHFAGAPVAVSHARKDTAAFDPIALRGQPSRAAVKEGCFAGPPAVQE